MRGPPELAVTSLPTKTPGAQRETEEHEGSVSRGTKDGFSGGGEQGRAHAPGRVRMSRSFARNGGNCPWPACSQNMPAEPDQGTTTLYSLARSMLMAVKSQAACTLARTLRPPLREFGQKRERQPPPDCSVRYASQTPLQTSNDARTAPLVRSPPGRLHAEDVCPPGGASAGCQLKNAAAHARVRARLSKSRVLPRQGGACTLLRSA